MTHHPGIHSPRHLFDKLTRELATLEEEVTADHFANFVITAHSMCDWVDNDPAVPAPAKAALPTFRSGEKLQVCRDLANGTKHFQLSYPNRVVVDATCVVAYGAGRYGKGQYGTGEASIQITMKDGSLVDGLEVAREVTSDWDQFLSQHGV